MGGDGEYRVLLMKKLADDLESYTSTVSGIRVNKAWVALSYQAASALKKAAGTVHLAIPQIKDMEHLVVELS